MARKRRTPAVVLVLCAALFAWGLLGKLSGYTAPDQSHHESVVKLIRDEQTRRLAVSVPAASANPFLGSPDLAAVYSQPRLIMGRIQHVRKSAPDSTPSYTYALRFRPPPLTI